ncbi:MAG TPA: diaminopimelate decarboxylase [Clostridiales bacterium]|nr:MAG: diaminopimelate decarboxylase [Clostridiales bacterium GWD2_32_19]HCC07467.1 diaminopimelate decarboxylase [Clostridiales bacterium]
MSDLFTSNEQLIRLIEQYGSPLYVYDENMLRSRCKEMRNLLPNKNFRVNYSAKANCNLELLKIALSEDVDVDAMSSGEIFIEESAGFSSNRIFYVGNNVSADEMMYAVKRGIIVSVDSLSQLELFGETNRGGQVAVRFNTGVGAGHHEKVVTGGKKTKFGVQREYINIVKEIIKKYDLKLIGINQHIGSLILEEGLYIDGVKNFLEIASEFTGLKFIDMGGGFGVPYKEGENRLDLSKLSEKLDRVLTEFLHNYDNKELIFKVEPGRYLVAESGILLGTVYSVKDNYGVKYVGTDLGFNVLVRPTMYDSHHEVKVIKRDGIYGEKEEVTIVGNICESGDIIAKHRLLPKINEGDIIAVMNAGAYGFSMSSNYNCRLKPAEVLLCSNGEYRLIRRRDTFNDLMRNFE